MGMLEEKSMKRYIDMAKGSKRNRWLKDGIKESRKVNKRIWNTKVRNNSEALCGCTYKKIAKASVYDKVL